jgi:hypothetical protein
MNINDRDLLAKTLQAEAGNQGLGGMLAAGSVIMNRTQTPGYGSGLRGVILKPGQFSAWNSLTGYAGGEQGQDMLNMRPSAAAYQAADKLLAGDYQDQTGGATHYYNPSISNPKWGQKRAGGDWQRIGDHIFGFADAGRGKRSPQATVSTQGAAPMMQQEEQQPRGETAQPFYQRDSFKDTAAILAQGFGRLGIMGMEEIADNIAKQRTEIKAKNKTVEFLRKSGRADLADAVANNVLGARDAASMMFAKPKDARTALMKNYEFFVSQGMSPEQAMAAVKSGPTINTGDVGQGEYLYGAKAGLKPGYRLHIKTGVASAIPGGPADTAAAEAKAADAGLATQATAGTTVLGDITEMKKRVEESPILTTGFIGGLLKNYGGTGALDVNELGKTIRANIGFDRLQRMREESPTGGALGQVAVQELEALQASLGSLNTSQGAPQLLRNLERLETQYRKSMKRILETEGGAAYFTQGEADQIKNPRQGSLQTKTGVTYKVID